MNQGKPIRVGILTGDLAATSRLLVEMRMLGVSEPIVVAGHAVSPRPLHKRLARFLQHPAKILAARFNQRTQGATATELSEVRWGGSFGTPRFLETVNGVNADLLVLVGCPIVGRDILELPRLGVMNGHPALLPWCRGNCVVGRSIERGIPIGATIHYVSAGIDEGDIIERRLAPVEGRESLAALESLAYSLVWRTLAQTIARAVSAAPQRLTATPQQKKYKYCQWCTDKERRAVQSKLSSGEAVRRYREWFEEYGAVLPPQVEQES